VALFSSIISCVNNGRADEHNPEESPNILGTWVSEFQRNGENGQLYLEFTDEVIVSTGGGRSGDGRVHSFEIGNGVVMDQWFAGLSDTEVYRYKIDEFIGFLEYPNVDNRILLAVHPASTWVATIHQLPGEVLVQTWESDFGGTSWLQHKTLFDYKFVNDGNTLELTSMPAGTVTSFNRVIKSTGSNVLAQNPSTTPPSPKPFSTEDYKIYRETIHLLNKFGGNRSNLEEVYGMIKGLAERNPDSGYPIVAFAELRYTQALGGDSSYSEALSVAQQALEIDPKIADAYVIVAKVLINNNNYHGALAAARRAIGLAPDSPEAMFAMARAAEVLKRYDESEHWYRKCISSHTDNVRQSNIYGWLGTMLATKIPADIEGATLAKIKAADLVFDTGAWKVRNAAHHLLMNTDQFDLAIYYAEQALSLANFRAARWDLGLAEYYKWGDALRYPKKYRNNPRKPLSPEEITAKTGVSPEYVFTQNPLSRAEPSASFALWEGGYIENIDVVPKGTVNTALISATYGNHMELVKLLVKNGANVNARDSDHNQTPIFYAVQRQNLEMVKFLVDHGARINLINNQGLPLAQYAVNRETGDRISIIRYLLEQGIDPEIPNKWGETLIVSALISKNLEAFRLLITEYDADVNARSTGNTPILALAAVSSGAMGQKMLKVLLDNGANPWVKYNQDIVTYLLTPGHNEQKFPAFKENAALIQEARKSFPKPPDFDQD